MKKDEKLVLWTERLKAFQASERYIGTLGSDPIKRR